MKQPVYTIPPYQTQHLLLPKISLGNYDKRDLREVLKAISSSAFEFTMARCGDYLCVATSFMTGMRQHDEEITNPSRMWSHALIRLSTESGAKINYRNLEEYAIAMGLGSKHNSAYGALSKVLKPLRLQWAEHTATHLRYVLGK